MIEIPPKTLRALAHELGGQLVSSRADRPASRIAPPQLAGTGDITPLLSRRYQADAREALSRGALLLVDAKLRDLDLAADWVHPHATWAMSCLLDHARAEDTPAVIGEDCVIAPTAIIGPRVLIGARVRIGPGAVIGSPGFGWVETPDGQARAVPQLGGVTIEDDVSIGALTTVDAGTLGPTIIRRGAKLDAHVHVGHNADIGEGAILCAQTGLAGSVIIGRGAVLGGQVGVADHCHIGAGAKIAAKSGVIGDVPEGATVAGYPAMARMRWLRGVASAFPKS